LPPLRPLSNETRVLSGEPGRQLVVARRDGGVWYVGGVNGADSAQSVRVDLSLLKDGSWAAAIVKDGATDREFASETRTVTPADAIDVAMRAHGGFAIRLERTAPPGKGRYR
jgi:alpha-glucosidase